MRFALIGPFVLLFLSGYAASQDVLKKDLLDGKCFQFTWRDQESGGFNGLVFLNKDGSIGGIDSPNETSWELDDRARLIFKHSSGKISSIFDKWENTDKGFKIEGIFTFREGIFHRLEEVKDPSLYGSQHWISTEYAAKNRYSTQKIIYLDEGETYVFTLKDGRRKTIGLKSVKEQRDGVVNLVRRADVNIEIDNKGVTLCCEPFAMPREIDGVRIQADTTTGWLPLPKRVQFSVWDASEPVVDASLFQFPLKGYRIFSQGMQGYNEPVHLGWGDDNPKGGSFYHNYGVDFAGYEGKEEVVSSVEGKVVKLDPIERPSMVAIEDENGWVFDFCHLDSVHGAIKMGSLVKRGQVIGRLGRQGASGNFSHLHIGGYLSKAHLEIRRNNLNFNLYPWLVWAYEKQFKQGLYAVARPHIMALTQEKVVLSGANSISFDSKIKSYQWRLHHGETREGVETELVYDKPGVYMETLWITDETGKRDVDFCKVKVYSREKPEGVIPTVFVTFHPTEGIRTDTPVSFRCWVQGDGAGPVKMSFDDGAEVLDYEPYSELVHGFKTPGIHVVTASASVGEMVISQKVKVVVKGG